VARSTDHEYRSDGHASQVDRAPAASPARTVQRLQSDDERASIDHDISVSSTTKSAVIKIRPASSGP
jgi:hypothetical protein